MYCVQSEQTFSKGKAERGMSNRRGCQEIALVDKKHDADAETERGQGGNEEVTDDDGHVVRKEGAETLAGGEATSGGCRS